MIGRAEWTGRFGFPRLRLAAVPLWTRGIQRSRNRWGTVILVLLLPVTSVGWGRAIRLTELTARIRPVTEKEYSVLVSGLG